MSKKVLITGASGGLGMELARACARRGYALVLTARRNDRLQSLKAELSQSFVVDVQTESVDLSVSGAAQTLYQRVCRNGEGVDVLINNAGFGLYGDFIHCDVDESSALNQVNLTALLQLTHLFLNDMKQRGHGHIVNVASIGAFFPGPLMSVYFAAKAYVLSLTEALGVELEDSGVDVSVFCPGPFKSEFQAEAFGPQRDLQQERKLPTSARMAESLLKGIDKKQRVIIPGVRDKLIYTLSRICSRRQMAKLVYAEQMKIMSTS